VTDWEPALLHLRFSPMRRRSENIQPGIDMSLIAGFLVAVSTLGFLVFAGRSDLQVSNDLNVNVKPSQIQTPTTG
jgi:hypothetical protein